MSNINDAFPSKYIKASDLRGGQPTVTIDHVAFEQVGRERESKPVVYFRGKEKGLVLNKTNANKITSLLGTAETEAWEGRQIRLYGTEVEFGGETVEGIRVKAAAPPPPNGGSRQAAPPSARREPEAPPPTDDAYPADTSKDEDCPF